MNETAFKRLLLQKYKKIPFFKFDSSNAVVRMNKEESYFCNLISACSEVFSLSSLNINDMYDLIKKTTPVIYHLSSWVQNHLEKSTTFYDLENNVIDFKIKFHFYEDIPEKHYQFGPDGIIDFNFEFKEDGDILTKIKTLINKELENSSDITFDTDFVKIIIVYKIKHKYLNEVV